MNGGMERSSHHLFSSPCPSFRIDLQHCAAFVLDLALRIDVSMLHARTGKSHPKLNERVSIALNHIDATMKAVRAAINNLRPTVLDLGLNAAIEWQVADFQRRSGISVRRTVASKNGFM